MGRLLVIAEHDLKLGFLKEKYDFMKLRKKGDGDHMLKVFEEEDTYRIITLKERIEKLMPDRIVVIGELKDYRWLATVVCRACGNFNSWVADHGNAYGSTHLDIKGEKISLKAFDSLKDWRAYYEIKSEAR